MGRARLKSVLNTGQTKIIDCGRVEALESIRQQTTWDFRTFECGGFDRETGGLCEFFLRAQYFWQVPSA